MGGAALRRGHYPPQQSGPEGVGEAEIGTNAKCRPNQAMSAVGAEAENICSRRAIRLLTQLYGPAVRCKPNLKNGGVGLAHLYQALAWSVCAPGHHGYPRAPDLILRKALRGRLGHQITGATARPFVHLLKSNSQTSAGIAVTFLGCARDQPWTSPRRVRAR